MFWKCTSVFSNNLSKKSNRHEIINQYIDKYINKEIANEDIKFNRWEVWSKMYRKSYIDKINIKFDETFIANDVMFVLIANFHLQEFKVIPDSIYCITYREDSITFRVYNSKKYKERIDVLYRMNHFFKTNVSLKYGVSLFVAFYRTSKIYQLDRFGYVVKKVMNKNYSLFDEIYVCFTKGFRKN